MNDAREDAGSLRWRCRRGMKELDVLLERWFDRHYATAADGDRRAFARLLELPDPQLAKLLLGSAEPTEGDTRNVIRAIRTAPDR